MGEAMKHIKPYFQSGQVKRKGTFIIGTVEGDLHDIGKNLVSMMVEGAGWEVVDLGTDVRSGKFNETAAKYTGCVVGMSALLTTTMINMEKTVKELKGNFRGIKIAIGGAPVTHDFCGKIGADFYSSDPQGLAEYLHTISS